MTSIRLDLRHLRLFLAVIAIALAGIASLPQGARAANTPSAEFNCWWEGGTWTVVGTTGYCKGLGQGKDYKCHLEIGQNACEYLLVKRPTRPVRTDVVIQTDNVVVVQTAEPTKTPTVTRVESTTRANEMSPLDE